MEEATTIVADAHTQGVRGWRIIAVDFMQAKTIRSNFIAPFTSLVHDPTATERTWNDLSFAYTGSAVCTNPSLRYVGLPSVVHPMSADVALSYRTRIIVQEDYLVSR